MLIDTARRYRGSATVGLRVVAVLAAIVVPAAPGAAAPEVWTEIRSPHFTVVTNGGESRGRNVAWQFEQIRGAIEKGWPWARVALDRPVLVLALKDAAGMKVLAPDLFKGRNSDFTWTSALVTASDRHIVALRADILGEDEAGRNPYLSAYWSYSQLAMQATFGRGMPLWLGHGFAGVLSNSIVRKDEIHFGRPLPDYVAEVRTGERIRLRELLTMTQESPWYANVRRRTQFDAQTWAFSQYLLFADPDANSRVPTLMRLLTEHVPSIEAVTQVYGRLEALEEQYLLYMRSPIFKYARLEVDSDVTKQKYPSAPVAPAALAALRAEFYLARGLTKEMRAAIESARAADATAPESFDVEAWAAERGGQADDAERLYEKAVTLGSRNFRSYYGLAASRARQPLDEAGAKAIIGLLQQAVALNSNFAPALHFLSDIHERRRQMVPAFDFAQRAAKADPTEARYWLSVARILSADAARAADAKRIAEDALKFAIDQRDRAGLQEVLDSLSRPKSAPAETPTAGSTVGGRVGAAPSAAAPPSPASAAAPPESPRPSDPPGRADLAGPAKPSEPSTNPAPRVTRGVQPPPGPGQLTEPPRLRKRVDPVYPAGLDRTKDFGTVIVSIAIAPDGTVAKASIKGQASKFDAAALEAVAQWLYDPVVVDGKPVTVLMDVPVNFGF